MPSKFREIALGSKRYRVRLRPTITPWEGVEAHTWIDGYGWDLVGVVRRPETLKKLHENFAKPETDDADCDEKPRD